MDILEIMKKRHSVRQYTNQPIEQDKQIELNKLIMQINKEAKLNIQIIYDDPKCFDSFMAHRVNFSGVNNYIALVGEKSPNLEQQLGYYGEKIVLKAQELGLNTCWVALTHGKSKAVINNNEKLVCLISIGYGVNQGVSHKNKPLCKVCNESENMPEWFLTGVNAALLAPTAMNQQRFFFELLPDGNVKASHKTGFYTNLDLGIVKYHFETATEKKIMS